MSTLFVDTINEKTSGNGIIIPGHVVAIHNALKTDTQVERRLSEITTMNTGKKIAPANELKISKEEKAQIERDKQVRKAEEWINDNMRRQLVRPYQTSFGIVPTSSKPVVSIL